jgi:Tfp pilus assembly protein PilV
MMKSKFAHNTDVQAGFSLLEAMVAIGVLTLGMGSIAALMTNVYKNTVRSRFMSSAARLASEKLEDLTSYGLSDPRAHLAGGSLTADTPPVSQTWNSGTVYVDYYDTVTLNSATGAMSETYEILNGTNVQYVTQSFTADGLWHWNTASGYPSAPSSTPPTAGETYDRRWTIQANTPVTGLYMITVLVTLENNAISPPVTFQMSTVRP